MLFKKLALYHVIPLSIAITATLFFIKINDPYKSTKDCTISSQRIQNIRDIDKFYQTDLTNQVALSLALKQCVPVLFGSSELTSHHLSGLAGNFFNQDPTKDHFFSMGHAGFQSFAILTVLAANKILLKDAKITIILSPGWFEKQYASGTSLTSFFEFCPPNYLYQIYKDTSIDNETKQYIENYLYTNYDKISKPDAVIRLMGKKKTSQIHGIFNYPFMALDEYEIKQQETSDFYLVSQRKMLEQLSHIQIKPYKFYNRNIHWDLLKADALSQFKTISNNNDLFVQNDYYTNWLKDKPKKVLHTLPLKENTEYTDFLALVHFLKINQCNPLFVIMPLNTKAHENLEVLQPTIDSIAKALKKNEFKTLDMFTANLNHYQEGVLEDIMHPYNIGWYQIDKFILEHYHDEK